MGCEVSEVSGVFLAIGTSLAVGNVGTALGVGTVGTVGMILRGNKSMRGNDSRSTGES